MLILLTILKIIGIVLLVIAAVIAVILFVPLIYRFDGTTDDKNFHLNIRWLGGVFSFRVQYENELTNGIFLFGKEIHLSGRLKRRRKKKKRTG